MAYQPHVDAKDVVAEKISRLKREIAELEHLQALLQKHVPSVASPSSTPTPASKLTVFLSDQAVKGSLTRDDVRQLLSKGPATIPEIAIALNRSIDTLRSAIDQLEERGEVVRVGEARPIVWMLTKQAAKEVK